MRIIQRLIIACLLTLPATGLCTDLRYALEVQDVMQDAEGVGDIVGACAFSPASLHEANPGLFHYGIHGVETLYGLMGPGCVELSCMSEEGGEVSVGRWADGRVGTVRGTRAGAQKPLAATQ